MAETLGTLIDKLTIVNLRIWKAEELKRDPEATDKQIADATRITNIANTQRNDLMQEIDELFLGVVSGKVKMKNYKQGSTKSYGK